MTLPLNSQLPIHLCRKKSPVFAGGISIKQVPPLYDCRGDKDRMARHQECVGASQTEPVMFSLLSEQTPSHRNGLHRGPRRITR